MNIIFNGKTGPASIVKPWVAALNDPRIVTEKAGFLFKASLTNDGMELAVFPCLVNGERSYHYNMHLETEDAFTLVGDVSASGVFNILFKPERMPLSDEQKARYARTFQEFAALLLDQGYSGEGRLNEVTQTILPALGLSPAPQSLAALVES